MQRRVPDHFVNFTERVDARGFQHVDDCAQDQPRAQWHPHARPGSDTLRQGVGDQIVQGAITRTVKVNPGIMRHDGEKGRRKEA